MQSREQKQQTANSSHSILTAIVYTSRSTFGDRFIRLVPRPGENESTDRVNNNMNDAHDAYRSWLNFFMMMFGVSCSCSLLQRASTVKHLPTQRFNSAGMNPKSTNAP